MKLGPHQRGRARIDKAVHELHQAVLDIREVRPLDAARVDKAIVELIAVMNNLRRG